ncbi:MULTISPECIES: MliC family protein [Pantoea]|uniref:Membrane-bound inhibitor of C-type lysozyme n=2 Tax=Pantoea TaxID=53335 RepID=A0A286BLP0_9GAMM|nr:MliC family protein [Pantoea floridensis]PIF22336.1 membrane-bound inhibitor of C-type lysozyme [Enterobacteriaceae bacterium JKS000233]SOD35042.1 Membrane-bound inhibitor of C-type lysozyme [Pantoea floridensis]
MKKRVIVLTSIAILSGCGMLHKPEQTPQQLHYQCGTLPLTVTQDNAKQQVSFILDGKPLTLTQTEAASGARYSDGTYVFWSKGDSAFVERNNKIVINDCALQNADTSVK